MKRARNRDNKEEHPLSALGRKHRDSYGRKKGFRNGPSEMVLEKLLAKQQEEELDEEYEAPS